MARIFQGNDGGGASIHTFITSRRRLIS